MSNRSENWGGARKGAGRRPKNVIVTPPPSYIHLMVMVPEVMWNELKEVAPYANGDDQLALLAGSVMLDGMASYLKDKKRRLKKLSEEK